MRCQARYGSGRFFAAPLTPGTRHHAPRVDGRLDPTCLRGPGRCEIRCGSRPNRKSPVPSARVSSQRSPNAAVAASTSGAPIRERGRYRGRPSHCRRHAKVLSAVHASPESHRGLRRGPSVCSSSPHRGRSTLRTLITDKLDFTGAVRMRTGQEQSV